MDPDDLFHIDTDIDGCCSGSNYALVHGYTFWTPTDLYARFPVDGTSDGYSGWYVTDDDAWRWQGHAVLIFTPLAIFTRPTKC